MPVAAAVRPGRGRVGLGPAAVGSYSGAVWLAPSRYRALGLLPVRAAGSGRRLGAYLAAGGAVDVPVRAGRRPPPAAGSCPSWGGRRALPVGSLLRRGRRSRRCVRLLTRWPCSVLVGGRPPRPAGSPGRFRQATPRRDRASPSWRCRPAVTCRGTGVGRAIRLFLASSRSPCTAAHAAPAGLTRGGPAAPHRVLGPGVRSSSGPRVTGLRGRGRVFGPRRPALAPVGPAESSPVMARTASSSATTGRRARRRGGAARPARRAPRGRAGGAAARRAGPRRAPAGAARRRPRAAARRPGPGGGRGGAAGRAGRRARGARAAGGGAGAGRAGGGGRGDREGRDQREARRGGEARAGAGGQRGAGRGRGGRGGGRGGQGKRAGKGGGAGQEGGRSGRGGGGKAEKRNQTRRRARQRNSG